MVIGREGVDRRRGRGGRCCCRREIERKVAVWGRRKGREKKEVRFMFFNRNLILIKVLR